MTNSNFNLVTSLSNVFGLVLLSKAVFSTGNYIDIAVSGLTVLASTLMHLSETKHGLPGYCLVKYSNRLLWFDRIIAYFAGSYAVKKIYYRPEYLTRNFIISGIIGLASLFVSENYFKNNYYIALSHSIWHFCAYKCLNHVLG